MADGGERGLVSLTDGVQQYMSKPITRMIAPATKPVGREDGAPRYGSGSVNTYIDIGTVMSKPQRTNISMVYSTGGITIKECSIFPQEYQCNVYEMILLLTLHLAQLALCDAIM